MDGVAPTVSSIAITSTAKTYKTDDTIQVTMTFSENVTVTGTPQLTSLKVGQQNKFADYTSGTGTPALVFECTVVGGDTDTDGISIEAGQLELNNGAIRDVVDNDATLTHTALATQAAHKVDGVAPTISSIAITSTGAPYRESEKVQATVTFSENVTVTGTPQLTLKIGSANKTATYTSGTGTAALVFEYTVAAGDTDTDGISIEANKLSLNSGTLRDAAGNNATLTHTALTAQTSHKVDTTKPTVSGISIGNPPQGGWYYGLGQTIQATVTFSENVTVTGTPQLTLKIGAADKTANYKSGTGTTALVFEYTVVAGDTDMDGIEIEANKLKLNNGTIKDAAGNDATLTHTAPGTQRWKRVDTTPPRVEKVEIVSNAGTYATGDKIEVQVIFSESVYSRSTIPDLSLTLKIGAANRTATYTRGDATRWLVFEYTVVAGDADTDGISIEADSLALNSDIIKDDAGNTGTVTHDGLTAQAAHKVDGVAPTVSSIAITSTGAPYRENEKIQATVTFSEKVTVTGTPQLTLKVGTADKTANYKRSTSTTALFEYTVVAGDTDTDGISIAADELALNSGTIKDAADNPATLTHNALTTQASHKVDAVAPTVSSIAITSTGAPYRENEKIQATVTFSENVTVTGTPQLTLTIGSADKTANYKNGTSTTALVFEYTVAAGDTDTDGIAIDEDRLKRGGGTIRDTVGNNATLTHTALTAQASHTVDTTAPTVDEGGISITSSAPSSDDYFYKLGATLQATVTFSENVTVTGTPQLTLKIGTANKTAAYKSGTGTTALVFEYTVAVGDADTDGIEIEANKLKLNSGTIKDSTGNAATLTHTALTAQDQHKVDGIVPTVEKVEIISNAGTHKTYSPSTTEKIALRVTFSEDVLVKQGTGQEQWIVLTVGAQEKEAYAPRPSINGFDKTVLFELHCSPW